MADEEALCREFQRTARPPAPLLLRLRARLHGRVDDAAYWLVCHDRIAAARRLWKLFRMW